MDPIYFPMFWMLQVNNLIQNRENALDLLLFMETRSDLFYLILVNPSQ
jgi:hypothetical protein